MTTLFHSGLMIAFLAIVFLVIRYEGLRVQLDGLAVATLTVVLAGLATAFTADAIQYRRWKKRHTQ